MTGTATGPRPAWRRAAFALFAVAFGTNVSTPLLLLYRDELGLSTPATTAVFGVYAAGLAPSLLLAGPLSDRFGRRPVVVPATVLAGAASLVFLPAQDSFALLLVARFLQGLVSGAVFTAGSAWLAELSALDGGVEAAGRRATVRLSGGFALGPFVSGIVAVLLPAPLVLPYLVHVALVAASVVPLLRCPETSPRRPAGQPAPQREPLLRPGSRPLFLTAVVPLAVCVYAFPATAVAGVPLLVELPGSGVLVTAVIAGLTLGAGAVVAPAQRRMAGATAPAAAAAGALGFGLTVVAAATGDWGWLLPAALLLGAGNGWALSAGLSLVVRMSTPARRGALTGVFYTAAYVGFAAPYALTALGGDDAVGPLAAAAALSALLAVRLVPLARTGRL